MKTTVKGTIRDEKGAVLIMVLILLVVGGLILTPLLGLMSTGLLAGKVYEKKMDEYYAADAGVEDAIWRIQSNNLTFGASNSSGPWHLTVNGKNVTVEVYGKDLDPSACGENFTYQILSIATTYDSGNTAAIDSSTTVEAYIEPMVFDLFGGALVSSGGITFHKDCTVAGDVYYVTEIDGEYTHTDGVEEQLSAEDFPTEEEVLEFYQQFKEYALEGGTYNENGGNMDVDENQDLGPIYIPGNLDISRDVTINLTGVVYVGGYIDAKNTITISGAGSLVAEGNINLEKLANYSVTGDSVIMSLYGDIVIKKSDPEGELSIEAFIYAPNGTISFDKDITVVGSVIAENIQIDKDGYFNYVAKASSFGFPGLVVYGVKIKTYIINPPESQ